jgi:hypothetical protein
MVREREKAREKARGGSRDREREKDTGLVVVPRLNTLRASPCAAVALITFKKKVPAVFGLSRCYPVWCKGIG